MKIVSQTKLISALTHEEKSAMFALLLENFLGVLRGDFDRDLAEKEAVMLLRQETLEGEIVGFSTLMVLDLPIERRNVKTIFSGDTTVSPAYRNSTGFGIEIVKYFLSVMSRFPSHEIYYALISKGWRTYKVLPMFFKNFIPKHDALVSSKDHEVLVAFGFKKYPNNFDVERGLIVFTGDAPRVLPDGIDASPPADPDAHTRYFLARNSTYLSGTELVCIARVEESNFAPLTQRMLRTVLREKVAHEG